MLGPKVTGPASPSKSSSRYAKDKIGFEDSDLERDEEEEKDHGQSVLVPSLGKLDISAIENPPEANIDLPTQSDKLTMLS